MGITKTNDLLRQGILIPRDLEQVKIGFNNEIAQKRDQKRFAQSRDQKRFSQSQNQKRFDPSRKKLRRESYSRDHYPRSDGFDPNRRYTGKITAIQGLVWSSNFGKIVIVKEEDMINNNLRTDDSIEFNLRKTFGEYKQNISAECKRLLKQ